MKKKAIVAGHICIDITPMFPPAQAGRSLGDILQPGKLVNVENADVHTGGAVANTGLAMKRLGADVRLMGKVGDDAFGGMVRGILNRWGACENLLVAKGETTSYSVILANPGTDRVFLHHTGANDTFTGDDIPETALSDASLFHFGYPPLMRSMYEDGGEQMSAMFRRVHDRGIATSLDLAVVDPTSAAGKADWVEILGKTLPYVDFFVPSVEELLFMLDRAKYDTLSCRAAGGDLVDVIDVEADVKPLAERALSMGCRAILIKCGTPGMFFKTSSEEKMRTVGCHLGLDAQAWADRQGFELSFLVERVVSGTGAGDTSIASYLTAILCGDTPERCAALATAAGAKCVQSVDAISGLCTRDELCRLIDAGWEKRQRA